MRCLVVRGEEEVLRFPVPEAEARLGSDPSNDLVVPIRGVSRFHARLVPDTVAPRLFDLGSKNGLLVNGRRLREVALLPGLAVVAGAASITLENGETSDLEIGVSFPRESPGPCARDDGDSTDTGVLRGGASAQEAVSIIRQLDRQSRGEAAADPGPGTVLERIRGMLGARTVALLRRDERRLETDFLAGEILLPSVLGALEDRTPGHGPEYFEVEGCAVAWRQPTTRPGRAALVVMPEHQPFAGWHRDVLDLVLEQLEPQPSGLSAHPSPAPKKSPAPAGLAFPEGMVVGPSSAMRGLLGQIGKTVHSRIDVLILGETGTGKELVARMIHASGPRAAAPFVAINCAAIPSELLESELFGVRARVATGVDPQPGRILEARGGTLLLDEIGDMPPALQPKLLRFLQEREVHSIGASRPEKVDVRVLSTSNRELQADAKSGRFRADLYYRLRGLQFHVPPLRDRKDDIADLAASFAERAAEVEGKRIKGISRKAVELLESYDWPGNVRELQSEVNRAVLFCPPGALLSSEHFRTVAWEVSRADRGLAEEQFAEPRASTAIGAPGRPGNEVKAMDLRAQIAEVEREAISTALAASAGNQTRAAEMLGLTRNGLALKLRRLFRP